VTADVALRGWLRLTLIPGVGGESRRQLLKAFGLPDAIFSAGASALRAAVGATLAERLLAHDCEREIDAALEWAAQPNNHILTLADGAYPPALLTAGDPPVLTFAKGRVELLSRPALAIVGSRNATKSGEATAESFAETLSAAGLTIVSGLALASMRRRRGALARRNRRSPSSARAPAASTRRQRGAGAAIAERGVVLSNSTRHRPSPPISRAATASLPASAAAPWWSRRRSAAAR
jgi:DNA processing protein